MTALPPVLTTLSAQVLHITLNRPDRLNAFNEAMHLGLREAIERARTDGDVRAVLLTGAGKGFCAGQDLGDRDPSKMTGPPDLGATVDAFYNPLLRSMRALEKPIVCAVNGVAAGAGANIALTCDIVLAGRSVRFIQAFSKIGLVPDSGGTWLLPRLVGEARAKALTLLAVPVDAETAERWGMIWRAVADDELMAEATGIAESLAAGPTFGLGLTKRALQAAQDNSHADQLDLERDLQRLAGRSADYAEGVAAFLAKRSAAFTGR